MNGLAAYLPLAFGYFFPDAASELSEGLDQVFMFIFWVSLFFFVLIVALMSFMVVKYRRRDGLDAEDTAHHSTALELTWSVIPTILVIIMFFVGFKGYLDSKKPPKNAYEVQVTGSKWKWNYTYPNGVTSNELHVPMGHKIVLVMQSQDVIHSHYIPAFRLKQDVVPGRFTKMWFVATKKPGQDYKPVPAGVPAGENAETAEISPGGHFSIQCAEYCGTDHSRMISRLFVHDTMEDFQRWLDGEQAKLASLPPDQIGERVYQQRCQSCHALDDTVLTGPSFKGFWNHPHETDKGTVPIDELENYVRESILYPNAKIVNGFKPAMMSFMGQLKDYEINGIIAYLKKISGKWPPQGAGGVAGQPTTEGGATDQPPGDAGARDAEPVPAAGGH